MSPTPSLPPPLPAELSLERLASWGFADLQATVAIDSSSDETSESVPSTEGQRELSAFLARHFEALGFRAEQDASANLIVTIPATPGREGAPPIALMVHMDTAHGTAAKSALHRLPAWDGGRVPYPANPRLHVDAQSYPLLQAFVGDDLIHGDGDYPFGLDDKLGMAELMTLGRALSAAQGLAHGEVLLVFRPDEEIGRMAAVEGLADTLAARGVRFGYTVDGLDPFEVNVENFDAARARVAIDPRPMALPEGEHRILIVDVTGVNTHGATAKAEGYLNATTVFARAMAHLPEVLPLRFESGALLECNARIELLLSAPTAAALDEQEKRARAAFTNEVASAERRGAAVAFTVAPGGDLGTALDDGARRALAFLAAMLAEDGPSPLLSEDSSGRAGYTNPHRILREVGAGGGVSVIVDVRLRDFSPTALAARKAHVAARAQQVGLVADIADQYVNMGPALARFPDVPRFAEEAATAAGFVAVRQPIRGGTGVDPFLARGIPIANLGTGYFAPESEKELTSCQNLARHVIWLAHLLQRIAAA